GPTALDPVNQAISSEELSSLVSCLQSTLSEMESSVLGYYLEDRSYEDVAALLGCETKTVDNALQRVKRKVSKHLESRDIAV
ncbi:MAG TPA: sigma factor-like helix-turn-helix DNA-binding protein, partial [Solirubrobacterales bacterium]|nr:sigma factor-like helix-turn-helix DNA-binding protein [Solirubrobacterales bacterium]